MTELVPVPLRSVHRWMLVALAVLAMAVSFFERQTLAALAPTICSALGLSNTAYGWASSAFALALLLGTPLAGILLDRVGARRGLTAAVVAWSFVTAAHGFVAGLASLVLLRILLGLAESMTFPGSMQVVRGVLPPADVPRGIGLTLTGGTFGIVAALVVAVALEQRFGWRAAFVGVGAISICWVPLWLGLSSAAAAQRQLEAPPQEVSRSAWSVFAHPAVARAFVFTLCVSPMIVFATLWWVKFLVARYGIAQADVARFSFLAPVAYDLGSITFGDLAARARRRSSIALENALLLAGSALAAAAGLMGLPADPWTAVVVGGAAYFGLGGAFAICNAAALTAVPRAQVSRASATIATSFSLAGVIANPLIGWSVDRTGSYALALGLLSLLVVPGAAAWLWLGRRSARLALAAVREPA